MWQKISLYISTWISPLSNVEKSFYFDFLLYQCSYLFNPAWMLRAVMNKSWGQHPTKYQMYGHLPPITKTIQIRWTRHAGHCWRSMGELISDVLQWTHSHGQASGGWPARTYLQQLCVDTGCSLEDLPGAMDDRKGWWERGQRNKC